jgi:hypothetical protein
MRTDKFGAFQMTDEQVARIKRDRWAETQPPGTATFDQLRQWERDRLTAAIRDLRETMELISK